MRLQFRQGIVQHEQPDFLTINPTTVDLVVIDTPTIITVADGTKDYLIVEQESVSPAWVITPLVTQWLYWDIDKRTGLRTFGVTLLPPKSQAVAPTNPVTDQHWFKSSNYAPQDAQYKPFIMYVWSGIRWIEKVRVFACQLSNGVVPISMSINAPDFDGTQAGIVGEFFSGQILFDAQTLQVLKTPDNKFITTEDQLTTKSIATSDIKFAALVVSAEAQQNMAAYTIVKFSDFSRIEHADEFTSQQQGQYGIIQESVLVADFANVVVSGAISNPSWNWPAVNAALYADFAGVLVTVPPVPGAVPVATVVDRATIVLGRPQIISNTTTVNNPPTPLATNVSQGTVRLNIPATSPSDPVAVGENDPRMIDSRTVEIVKNSGPIVAIRKQLNFIEGGNVTLTIVDDGGNDQVDITIAASSGGGGGGLGDPGANGVVVRTAPGTTVARTITAGTGILVLNGDGVAGNPTISSTVTQYTDELAQDAVGNILTDTTTINFTYNDAGNLITADLVDTAVTPGPYGSATQVATFTVDQQGRLTAAGNTNIAITSSDITDFNEAAQDAVGGILTDTSTIDFTYNDIGNIISAAVIANSSVQRVEVVKNSGAVVGARKQLNFIEGTNVTLTIADDGGNDQIDITIDASAGSTSPGGANTQIQFNDGGAFGGDADLTWDKTAETLAINGYVQQSQGDFSVPGDALSKQYVLRALTSNAVTTEMLINGSSRLVLTNDSTWSFDITIVARRTDVDDESASYRFQGTIDRNASAASTAIVGTVIETTISEDSAAWTVTVDADISNGALRVQVAGESGKTIRWVGFVRSVEVVG